MCRLLLLTALAVLCVMHVQALEYAHDEEKGPVAYEFHYSVNDPHTGDIKSQKEVRKDDKVEGTYELIDSDGHRRVVQYKADDHNGFVAVVLREPTDIKIPQPDHGDSLHKKLIAAPLVHYSKLSLH